jgi:hypothetical protein
MQATVERAVVVSYLVFCFRFSVRYAQPCSSVYIRQTVPYITSPMSYSNSTQRVVRIYIEPLHAHNSNYTKFHSLDLIRSNYYLRRPQLLPSQSVIDERQLSADVRDLE